ncbi:hypothetical protein P153DRAFT_356940 [Dothidotthia symphoricarpi CBS 119687]|uniref:Uncharacterized protein n=1 Tax=Dothidotthia symphoricarpi CBS 119687 TaxID=1392245 RepID=A0A6A6AE30_9PLEO|nr:uncharacterized protein P153DRAFT_356940 [Dothidotthia symphoricarpi CBS 119687]KAF2129355.1 hypothetical protein P153DRAFT_356940 [Dothidotthia symphoricarpi CBS 119687]
MSSNRDFDENVCYESSSDQDLALLDPASPSIVSDNDIIEAHQSKCAICHLEFSCTNVAAQDRISHFQKCWARFGDDLCKKKRLTYQYPAMESLVSRPGHSLSSLSPDGGHGEAISEILHIDGEETSHPIQSAVKMPLTSCLLCKYDFTHHRDKLDGLHHLMRCMNLLQPPNCPICLERFHDEKGRWWFKKDMIWHLHNCQHGGSLGVIARDDFEASLAALCARSEVVERTLMRDFGIKRHWDGRQHRAHYTTTRSAGQEQGGGVYVAGNSLLRKGIRFDEEGSLEITTCKKSTDPAVTALGHFRRFSFSVLKTSEWENLPEGFRVETVSSKTIPPPPTLPLRPTSLVPRIESEAIDFEKDDTIHESTSLPLQSQEMGGTTEPGQLLQSLVFPEYLSTPKVFETTTAPDVQDYMLLLGLPPRTPFLPQFVSEKSWSTKLQEGAKRKEVVEPPESHLVAKFQETPKSKKTDASNQLQNPSLDIHQDSKALPGSVAMLYTANLRSLGEAPIVTKKFSKSHKGLDSLARPPRELQARVTVAVPNATHLFPNRKRNFSAPVEIERKQVVYAHTKFLPNNRLIVFGEGIVPPRPSL